MIRAALSPLAPLLIEAAPLWRRFIRLRHYPRLARLRQLERELNPADMRLAEVIRERLWLERAP